MEKPKSFVIDREKWLHGEGAPGSKLLRSSDGKMCCLGFYALACGLQKGDIADYATPLSVRESIGATLPGTLSTSERSFSTDCLVLMEWNDMTKVESEEVREKMIIENFKKIDVDVTFIN